ncbi:MAG: hypothetical protein LBE82_09060 [Chitinophagaceae bacterium]|nr:hypothetical protein [Chitinophagaceae bacterium]
MYLLKYFTDTLTCQPADKSTKQRYEFATPKDEPLVFYSAFLFGKVFVITFVV